MKTLIIVLSLILPLFCDKLKTIDVHDAWESYSSASVESKNDKEIEFPKKEVLSKLNKKQSKQIKELKLLQLENKAKTLLESNSFEGYLEVGVMYAQNYFFSNALEYFFKAAELNVTSSIIYNNIANVYYIKRYDDEAIKYYKKSLRYSKNNPVTLLNLSFIYYENGKFKLAEKYYIKATVIDPTLDRPEYQVLASQDNDNVESKAANRGVSRMRLKWAK